MEIDWATIIIALLAALGGGLVDKIGRWFYNNRRIAKIMVDAVNLLIAEGTPDEKRAAEKIFSNAKKLTVTPNKELEDQATSMFRTAQLKAGLEVAEALAEKKSAGGKLITGLARILPIAGRFVK